MRDVITVGLVLITVILLAGEPDDGRMSYGELTKKQCEGYHTLCRQWAAENGFDIPEPNETNQHIGE